MVEWGSVKLPELEYRPRVGGDAEHWPDNPGTIHLPTGLRLDDAQSRYQDRGERQEFTIYAPHTEDWQLRISVFGGILLERRIEQHLGIKSLSDLSWDEECSARDEFLRKFGRKYVCDYLAPDPGFEMPVWTGEWREAVLLLLFWGLENSSAKKRDPYPSKIEFTKDVPELFVGTFRNPAWMRL